MQQSFVADGRICRNHLSEAPAQGSDGIEGLVVNERSCQVDLGEEGEVMEELDEEARLDGGAAGEVKAEQVMTLFLKKMVRICKTRKASFKAQENEERPAR